MVWFELGGNPVVLPIFSWKFEMMKEVSEMITCVDMTSLTHSLSGLDGVDIDYRGAEVTESFFFSTRTVLTEKPDCR
jgi:hypothetical protein